MDNELKEIGVIGIDQNGEAVVKEPIFIKLSSYKNSKFLDIRKYYEENGEWKPTKKGITLSKDQLNDLLKMIKNNENSIEEWFK